MNIISKPRRLAVTTAVLWLGMVCPGLAMAEGIVEAIKAGKASGQLRYRLEQVDDVTKAETATASTLRTQLGYLTGDYKALSAFVQFEDVRVVGDERYNSGVNGLTQYPTVSDPRGTEANQGYLSYKGLTNTVIKYGRQTIALDNQRFVGSVDWRQNQQTFDALSLSNTSLPDGTVFYAHVDSVNRVFGAASSQGKVNMSSDLLNLSYKGFKPGTISAYGYLLDYNAGQAFAVTASNQTVGLRLDGGYQPGGQGTKWLYTAEYASQGSYADGASTVDGSYNYLMLGADVSGLQIKLHYELLSGDGTYGFATPLATLHAFNGWADKFLTTPQDGIQDMFMTFGMPVAGVNLMAAYHQYSADHLGYDYGTELNLSAAKKFGNTVTLLAKYAAYSGDANSNNVARNLAKSQDLDKLWLQADLQF
ncbi:MAG: alginate export family protein [Gammaproteobacteria bacterium]|nr:alginate export family protein [Gammaproteobacteria bacterium]